MPPHYSYRVDHDLGFAPHVWRNIATVCGCKTTTIERWAQTGSWIIGIGGNGTGQSNKLVYAMKVTEIPTYGAFRVAHPAAAAYLNQHSFTDDARVLVSSRDFYYFGNHALTIPAMLQHIIHPTQGCKRVSDKDIDLLMATVIGDLKPGRHGRPNNGPDVSC